MAANAATTCRAKDVTQGTRASSDLQSVIDAANAGDTVRVAGTCVGGFKIRKRLLVVGGLTPRPILNGARTGPVLAVGARGVVTLRDLVITGGKAADGAGIYNEGHLTLTRVLVRGNVAEGNGGGIYNAGALTLDRSVLRRNSADMGGGLYDFGARTPPAAPTTLYGSCICRNTATNDGGGIYEGFGAGLSVEGTSQVSRNSTSNGDAGGISSHEGTVMLRDSARVDDNTATGPESVGGIWNWDFGSYITMYDSSQINGNFGGGVHNGGYLVMRNWSKVDLNSGYGVSNGGFFTMYGSSTVSGNTRFGVGNSFMFTMYNSSKITENALSGVSQSPYGTLTMNGMSRISKNTDPGWDGGGIDNGGTITMNDSSLINRNSAVYGGGIDNRSGGTITMNDSSQIRGNTAAGSGGGIANYSGTVTMHGSSEIVRNRTGGTKFIGGGILNCDTLSGAIAGTNVVNNYPDEIAQITNCD
jgi:predicted outer membrane repeat protein